MELTAQIDVARSEFEALLLRNHRSAFALARRLTRNESDAEDLVQDACARARGSFDHYDHRRPFEPWLLRIVANLAIDCCRRRSSEPILSLDRSYRNDGTGAPLGSILVDARSSPEQQCISNDVRNRMQTALGLLSAAFQTAVTFADIRAWSYEDVAQKMRCPLGTVRSRLHRGRLALCKSLSSPSMALMD